MNDDDVAGVEKRPVYQVSGPVERCAHCGTDDPKTCMGHAFDPMPWPALPPESDLSVRTEYQEPFGLPRGAGGKVLAYVVHLPTDRMVSAARTRSDVEHAIRAYPSSAEVEAVARAARLLMARQLCPHVDQRVWAGVARLLADDAQMTDPAIPPAIGYHLDIRVWCADCGEPFVFVGDQLPVGLSPAHPTVDVEGTTLAAPLRPIQYPEEWGLNRPGYGVRVR